MQEIYLDNCATTRVDKDIAELALELMTSDYGNPSSLHSKGVAAQLRLDAARRQVADALGCTDGEVIFTSGGTEANNLALLGGAEALRRRGNTIVSSLTEHASVLEPLRYLERQGFTLRLVKPDSFGRISAESFLSAVDGDTILVSCALVNNEVGAIAPIAEIAGQLRKKNKLALLHCDAVQAFGKLPFSAAKLGVDLLTVSAHKLYAPKGCGALYVRRGVRIVPCLFGGGQEGKLRPGTENVPLACAFGRAAERSAVDMADNFRHIRKIYEYFVNKAKTLPTLRMNSPPDGTPYLCNLSVPGYRSEVLLHYLAGRGIYVSGGSACAKGVKSHVLTAMGLSAERVDSALRVSFCKDSQISEIDAFFAALIQGMSEIAVVHKGPRNRRAE